MKSLLEGAVFGLFVIIVMVIRAAAVGTMPAQVAALEVFAFLVLMAIGIRMRSKLMGRQPEGDKAK